MRLKDIGIAITTIALAGCGSPVDVNVEYMENPIYPSGSPLQKVHVSAKADDVTIESIKLNRGKCNFTIEKHPDNDPKEPGQQLEFGDEFILGASSCRPLKEVNVIANGEKYDFEI